MEYVTILKRVGFLSELDYIEIMRIRDIAERLEFRAGQIIVDEDTPCDAFFVIVTGSAAVEKMGRRIATLRAGEPMGEISFIDKGLRSASIRALEDSVIIKITADSFEEFLTKEPSVAHKVYRSIAVTLCRRLRESNEYLKLII